MLGYNYNFSTTLIYAKNVYIKVKQWKNTKTYKNSDFILGEEMYNT